MPALSASDATPVTTVCVVVHWNNAPDTLACLAALALQTAPGLTVVVVDNGSTDDSADQIARYMGETSSTVPMHLLRNGENRGFACGNNAGIRWAAHVAPRFFWLLNNDTVPPPDTLALLLAEAGRDPQTGLIGSVLFYAHAPSRVQAWGGGHVDADTAFSTHFSAPHIFGAGDYLTFASVLLRASMLGAIGLLDEGFFMYFEDAEFCLRAQRAGWQMAVASDTAILHREGGSDTAATSVWKDRAVTESGLRLIRLYGRSPLLGSATFVLRRLAKRVLAGRFSAARAVVAGTLAFVRTKR